MEEQIEQNIPALKKSFAGEMTPNQTVEELGKFIIGQDDAKKAVAIAVRNRARRKLVGDEMRDEIHPHNIIMIGPTGCGKTEIARRLSKLTGAPFVKVEATKYTEVGYVGRDVESMVRDLVTASINLVQAEMRESVRSEATTAAEERILDLLLPSSMKKKEPSTEVPGFTQGMSPMGFQATVGLNESTSPEDEERKIQARDLMRKKLSSGELDEREVELESQTTSMPGIQILTGGPGMDDLDMQMRNVIGDLMPKKSRKRKVTVTEARKIILEEEMDRLVDPDRVQMEAIRRAENSGIIFIDEIDKITARGGSGGMAGGDVSREGVQRDLLPIVEGATVQTRQGPVNTEHILFIAAGAFHNAKPSDLIPELQGRFPIRVELKKLTMEDFLAILTSPRNSLINQAIALFHTEGVELEFTPDSLEEIAMAAHQVNEATENIGARRLHTIMERLLEELSFNAPDLPEHEKHIRIDREFVKQRLNRVVEDRDLSHYIL